MGLYGKIGWCRPVRSVHRRAALAALEQVELAELASRQISELSGGQQQRVFLARALVQDADLYLMDEPFAGVDAATERAIVGLLRDLRSVGKTAIVVHHDLQTAPEYFDGGRFYDGKPPPHLRRQVGVARRSRPSDVAPGAAVMR